MLRAICHEVGNLLAASRLTAHLIARDAGDPETVTASRTIEDLAAQAGSLLAHVRLLVADSPAPRVRIAPRDLLEAVQRAQPGRTAGGGLQLTGRIPAGIAIEADADAVNHALCSLVDAAREAAGAGGKVELGLERARDTARFVVTDDGPPFDAAAGEASMKRGRNLVIALARLVARKQGGDLLVRRTRGSTQVRLEIPCTRLETPSPARGVTRGRARTPRRARAARATRPRAPTPPARG
ncbi:MAG TPA: ATP-binding protein [Myxococcota bacterium]|nr:ATP-binding protein [Myxococcota bacterium]